MPTKEQFEELIFYTRAEWGTKDGVGGLQCTASNGRVLFLPAAGEMYDTTCNFAGEFGYYWTSNPVTDEEDGYANHLFFTSEGRWLMKFNRFCGVQVRPVVR